ncbi:protein AKNAD1 [Dendropsophus ebraccatus]|uniref:protein AKNAD1 n=1 Tax=Dendropsophus ebraccatus TaxID=150705 RepID=UPI0038314D7A
MEDSEEDSNVSQKPSGERRDSLGHQASDTTDDEQEDLPYDGILECYLVPSLQEDEVDKTSNPYDLHQALISIEKSQPGNSPIQSTTIQSTTNDEALYSLDSSDLFSLSETISKPITQDEEETEREKLFPNPTIIPDVLLRHITKENLINPCEFIHYETMPEISMVESFEEAEEESSDVKLNGCLYDDDEEEEREEAFKEEYLEMYRRESMTNESNSDMDEKGNNEDNGWELVQENVEEDEFTPDEDNGRELIQENVEEDEYPTDKDNGRKLIQKNMEEDECPTYEDIGRELIQEKVEEDEYPTDEDNGRELIQENIEDEFPTDKVNGRELLQENVEEDENATDNDDGRDLIQEKVEEEECPTDEDNEPELIQKNVEEDEFLPDEDNGREVIQENMEEDECPTDEDNGREVIQENVEEEECPTDEENKESKSPAYDPHRRPSYEMKYGQGQVHYKLPDFSKVAPKVKIPKGDNVAKPNPTVKKAATSTNLIGQSFLIQDILDSMQPGLVKEDTFLDQWREQVLVDYDFNSKAKTVSPPALGCLPSNAQVPNTREVVSSGLRDDRFDRFGSKEAATEQPQNLEMARVQTEGDKMTGLLMEQSQALRTKVFQSLKSCLETLEIDYLSTKEKHRDLQLQVYRTGSQTVGDFDIQRDVEGQIFRLGMLLEDIREQINKSQENDDESATSTTSSEAHVLSPSEETDNIQDLDTSNADNVVTWSPNSTRETQILHDSMEKEAVDSPHQPCLHPDTSSTGTREDGPDPPLSDHSPVNSVGQPARKGAAVISSDIVPFIRSNQVFKSEMPNSLSQVEDLEDWILAEDSDYFDEGEIIGKLKKDNGKCSPHLRFRENEMRKTQRKFRKPKHTAILVQENDADLDWANCNGTQDSVSSEWLVPSHSGLFRCSSKSSISDRMESYKASSGSLCKRYSNGRATSAERHRNLLNPDTATKEYPKQTSSWPSRLALSVQNQSRPSSRLHPVHSTISHYVPSSRSSSRSSCHSQLTNSTVSTLQRKSWKNVRPNDLDYRDSKILNYVLDNALRTAQKMQKTSERMVQKLALDLVNRSSYNV